MTMFRRTRFQEVPSRTFITFLFWKIYEFQLWISILYCYAIFQSKLYSVHFFALLPTPNNTKSNVGSFLALNVMRKEMSLWRQNQHSEFAPSMDPDQPAHPLSLIRIHAVSEQHGSWSDCADAQAGRDQCWSQTHNVGFVVTQLKCC
jgi:hypothetical protein